MTPQTLMSQDSKILDPGVATESGDDVILLRITAHDLTILNMLLR